MIATRHTAIASGYRITLLTMFSIRASTVASQSELTPKALADFSPEIDLSFTPKAFADFSPRDGFEFYAEGVR